MAQTKYTDFARTLWLLLTLVTYPTHPATTSTQKPPSDIIAAIPDQTFVQALDNIRTQVKGLLGVHRAQTTSGKNQPTSEIITGTSGSRATFSTKHKEYHSGSWSDVENMPHLTLTGVSIEHRTTLLTNFTSIKPTDVPIYLGRFEITGVIVFRGQGTSATADDAERAYVALTIAPRENPGASAALQTLSTFFNDALVKCNMPARTRAFEPHITIATLVPREHTVGGKREKYRITDQDIQDWNSKTSGLKLTTALQFDSIIIKPWVPASQAQFDEQKSRGLLVALEPVSKIIFARNLLLQELLKWHTQVLEILNQKPSEEVPTVARAETVSLLKPQILNLLKHSTDYLTYCYGIIRQPSDIQCITVEKNGFIDWQCLYTLTNIIKKVDELFEKQGQ